MNGQRSGGEPLLPLRLGLGQLLRQVVPELVEQLAVQREFGAPGWPYRIC